MPEYRTPTDDPKLLAVVPLGFLSKENVTALLESSYTRTIREGETLIRKGESPSDLLIPVDGQLREVAAEVGVNPGEEIAPYEPVGLDCLLSSRPCRYSVVAAEETTVHVIPWDRLRPLVDETPGLETYLRLVSESSAVRDMDRTLVEMDCSAAFRAALLGALESETVPRGTWITREGEAPTFISYIVLGTIQAYRQVGEVALKPLWIVPNGAWQLWDACLKGTPLRYDLKAISKVELFKLPRQTLKALKEKCPEDFEAFAKVATQVRQDREEEEKAQETAKHLQDLFPPPPRPVRSFRLSYPFVAQKDKADCVAACLAMVSRFYGKDLTVQFWRDRIYTTQQGTSLFDVATACEKIGFVCHSLEIKDLRRVEPSLFPAVAMRRNHFLVVYSVQKHLVVVGDPAIGIRRMPMKEFQRGFDGYVLMLKPTEQFYHKQAPRQGYWHYLTALKGNGFEIGLVFATSLCISALSMVPAFLSQFIIDQVLGGRDPQLLVLGILAALVMAALLGLVTWLRHYYMAHLVSRFDFTIASAFVRKLYSLPYSFFATRHVGYFTHGLSELDRMRHFFTRRLLWTILSCLNLGIYGVALLFYSPTVAVLVYLTAPLLALLAVLFTNHLRRYYNETFAARSEQDSLLADQINGVTTIKALGAEVAARWRFEEALVRTLKNRYRFRITRSTLRTLVDFVQSVITLSIIGLAAFLAIRGQMTPGQVVAVSILAAGVISPFRELATWWAGLQEMVGAMDRLNEVFLSEPEQQTSQRTLIKMRLRGEIEFRDVWFRYGGESSEWALRGISFRILPGQRVALVGPSGAGKSTLALLTARFYEPTKGTILIDGRDYREFDLQGLREQIRLLPSETSLFSGTILENIAYGDPHPVLSRVERAAAMANAKEFIEEKVTGYDYMIAHGGRGLSRGQKQRIALARIFYTNPVILILDEGTSALDARLERAILQALKQSSQTRVLINILHRLHTSSYDYIVVLQRGQVSGLGTHKELVRQEGYYADLFGRKTI